MSSRAWQIVAAVVSIALMVVVLLKYGLRDDETPKRTGGDPHQGTKHFTSDKAHEGSKPSPLQVYANAKLGDWIAYRVITKSTIGPTFTSTVIARVSKVTDASVTRSFVGRIENTGEVREDRDEVRPRAGLTIDLLTENDVGGWTFFDMQISDEQHEIGGRRFACKKLGYSSKDPMFPRKVTRNELWISDEVLAGGLVEEREVQDLDAMHFEITKQLIGFGTADTTVWGTKPEGLGN